MNFMPEKMSSTGPDGVIFHALPQESFTVFIWLASLTVVAVVFAGYWVLWRAVTLSQQLVNTRKKPTLEAFEAYDHAQELWARGQRKAAEELYWKAARLGLPATLRASIPLNLPLEVSREPNLLSITVGVMVRHWGSIPQFLDAQYARAEEISRGGQADFARTLYERIAEYGHADAIWKVALGYWLGDWSPDGEPDHARALPWMRWAVEHGRPEAARNLAQCYECGDGVDVNLAKAIHWYRVAARLGDASSQRVLDDLRRRTPVTRDEL